MELTLPFSGTEQTNMAPVQDTLQQQGLLTSILGAENTPGVGPCGAQADMLNSLRVAITHDMHSSVKDVGGWMDITS